MRPLALALALLATSSAAAAAGKSKDSARLATMSNKDNARLTAIFDEDQAARMKRPIDWDVVAPRDAAHRTEVLGMLRAGKIVTSNDYLHAAMVFQHGETLDDYHLAFSLARIGAALDPSSKRSLRLAAAAWDRALMNRKAPQWYGSQYYRPVPDGPMELYKVDESAVTDEERTSIGLPSLQEAKDAAEEMGKW